MEREGSTDAFESDIAAYGGYVYTTEVARMILQADLPCAGTYHLSSTFKFTGKRKPGMVETVQTMATDGAVNALDHV